MTVLPPIVLLFDISAILAGKTREWQDFARVGECFVPRVVLEEIEFLQHRASEPDAERTAREFTRFYPDSGWKSSLSIASHPALKAAPGQAMSSKARLSLSVAQTAYGLSRNRPEALVVLVANDQGLMQKLRMIDASNLCGIPVSALLQWSRTLRRPAVIATQMQTMRSPVEAGSRSMGNRAATESSVYRPTARSTHRSATRATSRTTAVRSTSVQRAATRQSTAPSSARLGSLLYNLLTLAIVAAAILGVWRIIAPDSFGLFWQQLPFAEQTKASPKR